MRKATVLIATLAGLLLAAQAQAQAPGKGVYLGGGFGKVWSDGAQFYTNTVNETSADGGKVYAGYMWSDNWGMEVAAHHLGIYEVHLAGVKTDEFTTTAVSLAGVYTGPVFDSGFNLNFRAGVAVTNSDYNCLQICSALNDTRKRGLSGMIGFGVGLKLFAGLSVRFDFDHFGSVKHAVGPNEYQESYDVVSANLQLHF